MEEGLGIDAREVSVLKASMGREASNGPVRQTIGTVQAVLKRLARLRGARAVKQYICMLAKHSSCTHTHSFPLYHPTLPKSEALDLSKRSLQNTHFTANTESMYNNEPLSQITLFQAIIHVQLCRNVFRLITHCHTLHTITLPHMALPHIATATHCTLTKDSFIRTCSKILCISM
jgi:hypothetical protein